jgi:hypothetical protein
MVLRATSQQVGTSSSNRPAACAAAGVLHSAACERTIHSVSQSAHVVVYNLCTVSTHDAQNIKLCPAGLRSLLVIVCTVWKYVAFG